MTTPVETEKPVAVPAKKATKRKPAVKRGFNTLGKFFAKVRVDLELTTAQWAKDLGVSQLAITNVERGDHKIGFELAVKIAKLIQEKAPQYEVEYASILAGELNVLLIPADASREAVEHAYVTLVSFDESDVDAE